MSEERKIDRQADRQTDRHRKTDRQTDRQTKKQTVTNHLSSKDSGGVQSWLDNLGRFSLELVLETDRAWWGSWASDTGLVLGRHAELEGTT